MISENGIRRPGTLWKFLSSIIRIPLFDGVSKCVSRRDIRVETIDVWKRTVLETSITKKSSIFDQRVTEYAIVDQQGNRTRSDNNYNRPATCVSCCRNANSRFIFAGLANFSRFDGWITDAGRCRVCRETLKTRVAHESAET